jgi:hypothetical protein
MVSRTLAKFSITSLFQNRITRYPLAANSAFRCASAWERSACWLPSSSITTFFSGQAKSAMRRSDRMLPAKFQRGKAFAKGAPENPFNICGIGAEFTRQYCSSPKRALRRHSPPHPALSAPKGGEGNDSLSNTCRRFTGPCRPRLPWRGRRPPAACRRPSPRASALPRPRSVGCRGAASWRRRAGPCPGAPP